jgi:hypothetical protein
MSVFATLPWDKNEPEGNVMRTCPEWHDVHLVTALHRGFMEIHTHDARQTQAASALGLTPISI